MRREEPIAGQNTLEGELDFQNEATFLPLLGQILSLFEDGQIPSRLDPINFPDWVPSLILAEFTNSSGEEGLSFRFFGGTPVAFYGEMQDRKVRDEVAPETMARWLTFARETRCARRPMRLYTRGLGLEHGQLDIESLLVPTSSDGNTIDRIYCFGKYETFEL